MNPSYLSYSRAYSHCLNLESQRRQMSCDLSESLGHRSAANLLERLDDSCYRLENRGQPVLGLVRGPFGAFSAAATHQDVHSSASVKPAIDMDTSNSNEADNYASLDTNSVFGDETSWPNDNFDIGALVESEQLFESLYAAAGDLTDWSTNPEPLMIDDPFYILR